MRPGAVPAQAAGDAGLCSGRGRGAGPERQPSSGQVGESEGWQSKACLITTSSGATRPREIRCRTSRWYESFPRAFQRMRLPMRFVRITGSGYESDSPSRELARAIADVGAPTTLISLGKPATRRAFHPVLDIPPRPLSSRRRPQLFQPGRLPCGAIHGVARGLQPSAPECSGGEWRGVWRSAEVCRLRLCRPRRAAQCGDHGRAGVSASSAGEARVVTRNLDNNTTLHWDNGAGAPARHRYEIVWRETTAPRLATFVHRETRRNSRSRCRYQR